MDMTCSICGRTGIYWCGLSGPSPYTFCPSCNMATDPVPEDEPDDGDLPDALEEER